MKHTLSAWAIVRVDLWTTAITDDESTRITVKRIMWAKDEAENEAARLNALNADKRCLYFAQYTRVDPPPVSD